MYFFKDRTVFVASMHAKDRVLAPILEKELGVFVRIDPQFDTDCFGTFSGEIERVLSPMETLRKKCLAGMKQGNCDLGIATEGSFGPHPFLFAVPAHEELILLIDEKQHLEFAAKILVTETNFQSRMIANKQELQAFADEVLFPSHGIILKNDATDFQIVYKDAQDLEELAAQFEECQREFSTVHAETDMRAMRNPMRMKVIEQVCQKLVEKLKNTCPACRIPGFDVVEQIPGLPCSLCHLPTDSILMERYACQACGHSSHHNRRDGKTHEDPMYCAFCNP